jgi:uncharacterized RDD family membrane protein YckC
MADVSSLRTDPEASRPRRVGRGQRLASRDVRLGACLLDLLIGLGSLLPGILVLWLGHDDRWLFLLGVVLLVLGSLAIAAVQIVLLGKTGQTLGKKFLGIRIVRLEDEGNPGFVQAVLVRQVVFAVAGAVPVAGTMFALVDWFFIFGDDQRCLHDYLAGTKVIKA